MINYTDTAVVRFIREMFPEKKPDGTPVFTVVVAPPDGSRQALANAKKSSGIGIPGLSIYRTDIAFDMTRFTMPRAARGIPWAKIHEKKMWNLVRVIPVSCIYTVRGWARSLTDLAVMEREIAFSDIYRFLEWDIQGNKIRFPLFKGDPSYDPIMVKETGKVLFHSFKIDYEVDTQWVKTTDAPWLEKAVVNFRQVLSGRPVTFEALEAFDVIWRKEEELDKKEDAEFINMLHRKDSEDE